MMKKIANPPSAYASSRPGPASWIALAEPRNNPTPIVPPMAMSWMWRLRRLRERSRPGCDMRISLCTEEGWASGRRPEEGLAAALRQLVTLHQCGGAGGHERGGGPCAGGGAAEKRRARGGGVPPGWGGEQQRHALPAPGEGEPLPDPLP